MENKKIMFFSRNMEGGGGERVLSELSLNLGEVQKTIVLLENKISYLYQGKLVILNLPFSKKFFPKIFNFFRGLLRFRKIISQEKPEYILSFGNEANIINVLSSRSSLVRVENFVSESNTGFSGKLYNFLIRILFNRAKKVIVVSRGIENELIGNFGVKKAKIKLIYNPVDIKKVQAMSQEALESEYRGIFSLPVIINAGALNEQKGQWHLIRASKMPKRLIKI